MFYYNFTIYYKDFKYFIFYLLALKVKYIDFIIVPILGLMYNEIILFFRGETMKIAVIDGQGGGLGKTLVSSLKTELKEKAFIYALGCNSYASKNMYKAGAEEAIFGETNILNFLNSKNYDCIVGPIGIILPGGIVASSK